MTKKSNTNPKLHIKKGDTVLILSGDDKGKQGAVQTVFRTKMRAIVEGVNIVTKHKKPSAQSPEGSIVKEEAPVHVSNLMLIEPGSGLPSRVARTKKDGKSIRITKRSKEEIK